MVDDDEPSDGFDKAAHKKYCPDHSGINGHYCPEWDYLWICQDCEMEYSCCCCFHEKSLEEVL